MDPSYDHPIPGGYGKAAAGVQGSLMRVSSRTAAEIAQCVGRREATAVQFAEDALRSIRAEESRLHAFVETSESLALSQARYVDERIERGEDPGPLAGVPLAVKDIFHVKGYRTTGGSAGIEMPPQTHEGLLMQRLRQAGAVVVGKTNMNELGWGIAVDIPSPRNPVDASRIAGGSSGGSAAAVASGSVSIGLGTDGGGSIRMPAAFCGTVGFKPTSGLLPSGGTLATGWSLSSPGFITRNVDDAYLAMAAASGWNAPFMRLAHLPRLAVLPFSGPMERCVDEAARKAIAALDQAGMIHRANIEELDSSWQETWLTIFAAEFAATTRLWIDEAADLSRGVRDLQDIGVGTSRDAYSEAIERSGQLRIYLDDALDTFDALVLPTVDHAAPPGDLDPDDPRYFGGMRLCAPINLSGHPAVTVPIPVSGLPVGIQLIGHRDGDSELLATAAVVERSLSATAQSPCSP